MRNAIGIDLGTTNSAIACIDEHGKPVIIPNCFGEKTTPSVICFKGREIVIGSEAKELQHLGTYPTAAFFKRQMGDDLFIFPVEKRHYSAVKLSTILLSKIKHDAEEQLNQKITDVVITVPAYFRDMERHATIEAGRAAGLNVLQVINEPTAAAAAYGLDKSGRGEKILVYDLGGGTFDVTLLELSGNCVRVLNSAGDHQLGGKDWDERIIEFLATSFFEEHGIDPLEDSESLADLLASAEESKKYLSKMEKTIVSITHDGLKGRYELDRNTFERLTSDLMERTMSMAMRVLEDKDICLKPSQLNGVLLVGGSTRMPMVHRFIKEEFGKSPMSGINVDEAVALGAALVAGERLASIKGSPKFALKGRVKTIDVTNHTLGMIAINHDQTAYVNSSILTKNTQIPCKETRPYQHRIGKKNNELEIFMTQGESESPADVSYIGRYVVSGFSSPAGRIVVDIGYSYDESGTVKVEACEQGKGKKLQVSVEKLPHDVPERFMRSPEMQQDESEHVTAYLAVDMSGSMRGKPLHKAKEAALKFLEKTDLGHCSMGIIAFSDKVAVKLKATQNAKKIKNAIKGLTVCETGAGNGTDPFDEINSLLTGQEGRRFGIILTDGCWCRQKQAINQAKHCHDDEINIIAVGFGTADEQFLKVIASSDEAGFFTPMNGLADTFSTIAQVLTETGGGMNEPVAFSKKLGSRLKCR